MVPDCLFFCNDRVVLPRGWMFLTIVFLIGFVWYHILCPYFGHLTITVAFVVIILCTLGLLGVLAVDEFHPKGMPAGSLKDKLAALGHGLTDMPSRTVGRLLLIVCLVLVAGFIGIGTRYVCDTSAITACVAAAAVVLSTLLGIALPNTHNP